MKRLLTFLALTCAAMTSFGATLVPIQLLNPTGSAAGQAIVSTGASSAPGWTSVLPTANPAATGALTITNSATSGSTLSVISASNTISGAQIFMTGNGATTPNKYIRAFNANFQILNSANSVAIMNMDDAGDVSFSGNGTFTGSVTPSQTAGIIGTTTNNNANAGSVGEYNSASATAVSLSTTISANVTSVTLQAGDYDVWGTIVFLNPGTTTVSQVLSSISTTSATLGSEFNNGRLVYGATSIAGAAASVPTPTVRLSFSTATTVYLVALANFGTSTFTCDGQIMWRRRR